MTIPSIDVSIGMEVYSTGMQGISGYIKRTRDQFIVEEVLDSTLELTENADGKHEYPLYLLHKEGIDSTHAIKEVELATGLKFKAIGLKDAKAVTRQYVSSVKRQREAKTHVDTNHCSLKLVGYTKKPITKGRLAGNRFNIAITDFIRDNAEQTIQQLQDTIHRNQIANFYGYQRFGSSRAVTHLVGRKIIRNNFRGAVELFLCYPGKYDDAEIKEIREACKDSSKFQAALKIMPAHMDLERILLQEFANSNDPVKALRRLPITIRRLLVQAYQSYLFNRSLSKVIKEGYDISKPENGDVCFYIANKTFGMKRYDASINGTQLPAIPLAGYAFRDNNRFSSIVKSVMEEENLSRNDFHVKEMQELSVEGGFRQASLTCEQFSHTLDESLKLSFTLHKGCYATVLLRELMKPIDPIDAGF